MNNTFWNFAIVAATVLGPLAAVQATLWIERLRKSREERDKIFKVLMMTRAHALDPRAVEALNSIDVTFTRRKKDRPVRDAWHRYLAHLGNKAYPQDSWNTRRYELFIELLHVMAKAVGMDFDRAQLETAPYFPTSWGTQQDQEFAIRTGLVKWVSGETPLKVVVIDPNTAQQPAPPQLASPAPPATGTVSSPPTQTADVVQLREGQAGGAGAKSA